MNTQSKDRKYHQAIVEALDGLDPKNPGFNYAALSFAKLAENTHVPQEGRAAVVESLMRVGKQVADVGIGHADTLAATVQIDRAIKTIQAQSAKDGNGATRVDPTIATAATEDSGFTGVHG